MIDLIADLSIVEFHGKPQKLNNALILLSSKGISTVYFYSQQVSEDVGSILTRYLNGNSNIVLYNDSFGVQFRDGSETDISSFNCYKVILETKGFTIVDLATVSLKMMAELKIDKRTLPDTIIKPSSEIEIRNSTSIEFAHFGSDKKASLKFDVDHYINVDHTAFKNLVDNAPDLSENIIHAYLAGLLGVALSL